NWRCACPLGCGYSLSICDTEDGKLLTHCFGGCEHDEVYTALVEHGLFDDDDPVCRDLSPSVRPSAPDDAKRIVAARWAYDQLGPAVGSIAELYLRARGITIEVPTVLRFGPCPHRIGGTFPTMAAPVVDVRGEQIGVHLTYLRPDGSGKAEFGSRDLQRE